MISCAEPHPGPDTTTAIWSRIWTLPYGWGSAQLITWSYHWNQGVVRLPDWNLISLIYRWSLVFSSFSIQSKTFNLWILQHNLWTVFLLLLATFSFCLRFSRSRLDTMVHGPLLFIIVIKIFTWSSSTNLLSAAAVPRSHVCCSRRWCHAIFIYCKVCTSYWRKPLVIIGHV